VRIRSKWLYFGGLMALVIGLMLLALPAIAAPSSAVIGTVALDKNHYSDKSTGSVNYNIVKFTVTDSDLSSERTGVARFAQATSTILAVGDRLMATLQGEIAQTDTFSGTGTKTTFALKFIPEDADGDGLRDEVANTGESLNSKDIVVKLAGVIQGELLASVSTTSAGSSIDFVTAPVAGTDNVTVLYEYSEYNQMGDTSKESPLASVSQVAQSSTLFVVQTLNTNGEVTLTQPTNNDRGQIKVTFKYNVAELVDGIGSVSTPTAVGQDRVRNIDGKERDSNDVVDALSGNYVGKVALFQLSDFNKIESEAGDADNDADEDGIVQVDELNWTFGLAAFDQTCISTNGLCGRVNRAVLALFPGEARDAIRATAFRDLTVPVSDGETLTVTYRDASPSGDRTDTAIIDLTAPSISLVGPADNSYNSATLVTVEVNATDAGAGLNQADADITIGGNWSGTVKSPIANGFRMSRSASSALSEGGIAWNVTVTDKVGNAPKDLDTRAASEKLRGVDNPAVRGTAGNRFKFNVDTSAPTVDTGTASDTGGTKTGGTIDTRLSTNLTGTHTHASSSPTVLTDSSADFVTGKAKVNDTIRNLTQGSYGTITGVTKTTITVSFLTCSMGGGCAGRFNQNDSYSIDNPNLGVVVRDESGDRNKANVSVIFALGTGGSALDTSTMSVDDFSIGGVTPIGITFGKVSGSRGNKKQGVLLTMASDFATDAKPVVSLPAAGAISDGAGNITKKLDSTTTPAAKAARDGLVPVISEVTVTGETSMRPASRNKITVELTTSEATQTPTGFARYLKLSTSPDTTVAEDADKSKSLSFTSTATNKWMATFDIDDASGTGTPLAGLVNVRASALDPAGNVGSTGTSNPDGTDGKLKTSAFLIEFDNVLNKGNSPTFVISPEVGSGTSAETDSTSPFITVKFTDEAKEYEISGVTGDLANKADSHDKVTITKAELTRPDGTVETVTFKQSSDIDIVVALTDVELGEYKLTIEAKDELGNNRKSRPTTPGVDTAAEAFTYNFKVIERAKYSLTLDPGNNLVSLPGDPMDTAINTVIDATAPIDLVLTYDPADAEGPWLIAERNTDTGLLEGNLTVIDARHAYWIQTTAFHTLRVDVPAQAFTALPPTIAMSMGWNLVPTNDLTRRVVNTAIDADDYFTGLKWTVAYTFETGASKWWRVLPSKTGSIVTPTCKDSAGVSGVCGMGFTLLKGLDTGLAVGKGYWVWVTEDGTLVP
jgi:hypothetical protein